MSRVQKNTTQSRKPLLRPRPQAPRAAVRVQNGRVRTMVNKARTSAASFDLTDAISDVSATIQSSLRNPVVLITLLAAVALVVTHNTAFSDGVVGKWIANNPTNAAAIWIEANKNKFLGLVIFAPSVIASPDAVRVMLTIASLLWVMIIPEAEAFQYLIQSAALFLYFKTRKSNTRLVIIGFVIAMYYAGYSFVKPVAPA